MSSSRSGSSTMATIIAFVAGGAVTAAAVKVMGDRKAKAEEESASTSPPPPTLHHASRPLTLSPTAAANTTGVVGIADLEHMNFLSDIVNRLWPNISEAGSNMIREICEPMFKETLPSPLSTLRFTKVDLGKVPIAFDNIIVHEVRDGNLQFDLDVIWVSNSDIQLKADYLGKFGVKSMKLVGRMTFIMQPLMNVIPCFGAIQYGFINPPELQLDFTGLANVADFSVVDKSIRKVIQDVIGGMLVLPNRMMTKMEASCDFREFYQSPIGVARITCMRGRGFVVEKRTLAKDDVPDVYCKIKVGCEAECQTTVKKNSLTPDWNESFDFMFSDNDQVVLIEAWDEDKGHLDSDDFLGSAKVSVSDLLLAGKTLEVELQIKNQGTGAYVTIHCDIFKFTTNLTSLTENPSPNHLGGLLTMIVTQVRDLPLEKKDVSSFVKVTHGTKEFVTGTVIDAPGVDALNPTFDVAYRVPLLSLADAKHPIKFELMNGPKTVLAETTVEYTDLSSKKTILDNRKLSNGASLDFSVSLVGVETGSVAATIPVVPAKDQPFSGSPTAAGQEKVRVSILRGHGFKVTKKRLKKDIPDIYVQVKYGSSPTVWRTTTIKDNVAPEWKDEFTEYVMSSPNQVINLDVLDSNRRGSDDMVGNARITVGKVLLEGGTMELEIQNNGTGTGSYIVIRCEKV